MADLSTEQIEMVANFSGITGTPEDFAKTFLHDNGWQLEASVNQYMALMSDEMPAAAVRPGGDGLGVHGVGMAGGGSRASKDEDEALKRAIAESTRSHAMMDDEDDNEEEEEDDDDDEDYHVDEEEDIAAPPRGAMAREEAGGARVGSSRGAGMLGMQEDTGVTMEAFRNFAAEGMAVPQSAGTAAGAGGGMELLFPPPAELMFQGNFDALRSACQEQQKYCLVNIQKQDEFASHALNRDTWKHDAVKMVVKSSFNFWQQQCEASAGMLYLTHYPSEDLPVVDIVDPMTGALLERIKGYTSPEDMLERLTRFLDSHTWGKMGKQVSTTRSIGVSQAAFHSIEGPGGADQRTRMSLENEDAMLDAAIAASLQDGAPPAGCVEEDMASRAPRKHGRDSPNETVPHHAYSDSLRVAQEMEFEQGLEEDREKERVRQQQEEEELMVKAIEMSQKEEKERIINEKKAALPPEPEGGKGLVMLRMRLPDGSNLQRNFNGSEKLQVVFDYMFVNGVDPDQHTTATSYPRKVLDDPTKTLHELGLEGQTMLNVSGNAPE